MSYNGTSFVEDSIWKGDLAIVGHCQLSFSDFDNDGDLDINLIGCCDKHISYRNNGSTFSELQTYTVVGGPFVGIYDGSISMGDYDNDGDLDIVSSGNEGYTTVYLNNGSGSYTDSTSDPESDIINLQYDSSVVWGDLDSDNDLDLILIGYNGSTAHAKIYISNVSLTKNNTQPNASTSDFSSTYTNNILTLGWGNGSDVETNTSGLYYNLMVGNSTTNHTIVSGVYGGSSNPTAGYFGNMMQRKNITLNLELEANKTYYWYVQTIDTGLAKSNWSAVQTFNTSLDTTKPNITINPTSPNNTFHTINPNFIFNTTVADANLTNVTLYADWTGLMIANETNSSGGNGTYIFNKTLNTDGVYQWYIKAYDGESNYQTSATRTFYLDRAYPIIKSISPANAYTSSSLSVTFSYNISDTDIANCSLIIDGSIDQTDTSITEDTTQTFTKTMSNGNYNWHVNCTDYVGYVNSSATRSLTVSYTAPATNGGSSGGGGGGSLTTTSITNTTLAPTPEEELFDIDFSKVDSGSIETKQGDIKTFSFNSQTFHEIIISEIAQNSVKLIIKSEPIILLINLGETKQIDINTDGINDIEIKLVSITNGVANLLFKKLEGADIVGKEEIEEAIRKDALFDVKISIANFFEIVRSGREVIAEIEAFNVNNIGQVDVVVDYYITNKKDNTTKLAEGSDTLAVEAVASFVRSLKVPYDVKSGEYLFNVDIKYKEKLMASGHAEFRVIRNYEIVIVVSIFILVVVAIFFYLWMIKKRGERDISMIKRQMNKLRRRK